MGDQNVKIPRYYIVRIFLLSLFLYCLLMLPIGFIMLVKNMPSLVESGYLPADFIKTGQALDSIRSHANINLAGDSGSFSFDIHPVISSDSLINDIKDHIHADTCRVTGNVNGEIQDNEPANPLWHMMKHVFLLTLILGLIFNIPYKRYFNRQRKKKAVSDWLTKYATKFLQYNALINSGIMFISFLSVHAYLYLDFDFLSCQNDLLQKELFMEYLKLSVLASVLSVFFVYFWQKHNVHFKYLEVVYTPEELKKSIFRNRKGKIWKKFVAVSVMTVLFPLAIVLFYIVISLTRVGDLNQELISYDQLKIFFGQYLILLGDKANGVDLKLVGFLPYINTVDTVLMLIGISTGVFNAILYIIFFVKWTTTSVVRPVKELMENMKRTGLKEKNVFAVVRTNDEIGSLAEGFNVMSQQIEDYVDEISEMNLNLENKVIERTAKIERQKEEIETQRDSIIEQKNEIEAQRDEIEAQRNMAIEQRNQISEQKQEMTDSIQYAKRIQQAIIPGREVIVSRFSDSFILFKPRDIVSGDFYWAAEKREKLIVAAADCTGHGVPGALMSMIGIAFLNEIVNTEEELVGGLILDKLRKLIIKSLHQTGKDGEAKDGMDISLCVIDLSNALTDSVYELSYAGAHNPLYIISNEAVAFRNLSAEKEKRIIQHLSDNDPANSEIKKKYKWMTEVKADKMPIGIYYDEMDSFTSHYFTLSKGDQLYLFSDGYPDQFGGPKNHRGSKKFMYRPFRKLLIEHSTESMELQENILHNAHIEWKGNHEQIDDIVIIGLRL